MKAPVKSSLLEQVRALKHEGKSLKEIAEVLGKSESYIKKLSAEVPKKASAIDQALERLKENPTVSIDSLELSDSDEKNLYKSATWRMEILPARTLANIEAGCQSLSDIKKINKETRAVLEQNPIFRVWLAVQTEIEAFCSGLKALQDKFKQEPFYISACDGKHDLKGKLIELKAYRKEIPSEQRIGRSKQNVLPLYVDLEYVITGHNINVLEGRIDRGKAEAFRSYMKAWLLKAQYEETRNHIMKLLKVNRLAPQRPGKEEDTGNRKWIDADAWFARAEKHQVFDESGTNCEALAVWEEPGRAVRHRGRGGSSSADQRLAYAIGILK